MADFSELYSAILNGDEKLAVQLAGKALDQGVNPSELINRWMIPAMDEVGRLFEAQEYFVPEILMCADALYAGLDILKPHCKQMDLGVLRPVDASLAAQTFMGGVMGFILRRQLLHDPMALKYSRAEVVNHLVDSTLQGLYPR